MLFFLASDGIPPPPTLIDVARYTLLIGVDPPPSGWVFENPGSAGRRKGSVSVGILKKPPVSGVAFRRGKHSQI